MNRKNDGKKNLASYFEAMKNQESKIVYRNFDSRRKWFIVRIAIAIYRMLFRG